MQVAAPTPAVDSGAGGHVAGCRERGVGVAALVCVTE